MYSCSRHITHRSGIGRSLLAPSEPFSALSFEPEKKIQKKRYRMQTIFPSKMDIMSNLPSLSWPDLLAAARTLQEPCFSALFVTITRRSPYDNSF